MCVCVQVCACVFRYVSRVCVSVYRYVSQDVVAVYRIVCVCMYVCVCVYRYVRQDVVAVYIPAQCMVYSVAQTCTNPCRSR